MSESPTVFVLASNSRNLELLADALERDGYAVVSASTFSDADERVDDDFELAVVDVDGFSRAVLALVEDLHAKGTPAVVLSRQVSSVLRRRAMNAGALAVLEKPVARGELSHRLNVLRPAPS